MAEPVPVTLKVDPDGTYVTIAFESKEVRASIRLNQSDIDVVEVSVTALTDRQVELTFFPSEIR